MRGLRNKHPQGMIENIFDQLARLSMIDSDNDGIPDFRDCRPFDPLLQHIHKQKSLTPGHATQSKFIGGYGDKQLREIKKERKTPGLIKDQSKLLGFLDLDSDKDGVPDRKDCKPFNPKKQHIRPSETMEKRLGELPIYVARSTEGRGYFPLFHQHILSREAKKYYPKATTAALSAIKKYPSLVGKIERTHPTRVTFYEKSFGPSMGRMIAGKELSEFGGSKPFREVALYIPPSYDMTREEWLYKRFAEIEEDYSGHDEDLAKAKALSDASRIIFKDDTEEEKNRKIRESYAQSGFHELEHVKQSWEPGNIERIEAEEILDYIRRPREIEAREAAEQALEERLGETKISPEMYKKILELE